MIRPPDRIPYWTYLLLILVLVINIFYIAARLNIPIDGTSSRMVNGRCLVTAIKSGSPAEKAGIQTGDIVEALGNEPLNGTPLCLMYEKYKAGVTVSYLITRNTEKLNVSLTLQSLWLQNSWFYYILYLLIFIVSTTSLYILYRKPYDLTVRIFFIYLQLLSIAQNFRFLFLDDNYALFATIAYILSINLFGVVLLHFHLSFPQKISFYARIKKVLKYFYIFGAISGTALSAVYLYRMSAGSASAIATFNLFQRWAYLWMGITLALALTAAIIQFRASKGTSAFKQLRLVVTGSVFGLAIPILFSFYPDLFRILDQEHDLIMTSEMIYGIGNYIMTTFLAFAIFRYRIWNIEPIVKKAIFYGVATIFIYSVYILLISLENYLLVAETRMTHFIVLVISMSLFLFLRDKVQRLIDQLYYREKYNSAAVASEFEEIHAGVYEIEKLKSKIILYLNSIFHFKSFIYLIKTSDLTYKPIFMYGIEPDQVEAVLIMTGELDELLNKSKIFSTEELRVKPNIIEVLKGELVVPISLGQGPSAIMIVGSKRSEKSYTFQDIQVLSLLAHRIVALFYTADLYQQELDRKLLLERERTRIARDFHDDVGASLTRISILTQMIRNNDADPAKNKQWLQVISDTCREASMGINSIIWALNPKNDTFQGMAAYVRRFAMEFLEESPIQCTFNIPDGQEEFTIKADIRRNIYLCIRESLNNVMKHSGATKVCLTIQTVSQGFLLSIRDNGKGFDPDTLKYPGNGLINMRKRMENIMGEFRIETKPGNGTEISFSVPMKPLI
jgi:signal transduction histidine kinase